MKSAARDGDNAPWVCGADSVTAAVTLMEERLGEAADKIGHDSQGTRSDLSAEIRPDPAPSRNARSRSRTDLRPRNAARPAQRFGTGSGVAAGIPLTIKLTVQDTSCKPRSGAAVYLWHCDREGRYSLYSDGVTDENYLRGVQATDASGTVTFTSIFPAAYQGRWPHIHFEVYASLSEATAAGKISATSQIALPEDACRAVYATNGYDGSLQNMERSSLATDNVFRDDGGVRQLATMTGNAETGYVAALTIAV